MARKKPQPNDYTLTVKEAYQIILLSSEATKTLDAVYKLIKRKKLRSAKTVDGIRISESSLRQYIRIRKVN
jgi:hypothetical protein